MYRLFEVPLIVQGIYPGYDVTPNGNTFLMNVQYEFQDQSPLTLLVNWDTALKK